MLKQQLPRMESRDQRGPDRKEQWLILRTADRVKATLPEIHQAQGKERTTEPMGGGWGRGGSPAQSSPS